MPEPDKLLILLKQPLRAKTNDPIFALKKGVHHEKRTFSEKMKNAQVSGVIDFGMIRPASDPSMEFLAVFKRLCEEYPECFGEKDRSTMRDAYIQIDTR